MSDNEVRDDNTEAGNQKLSQRWMSEPKSQPKSETGDEKPPKRFNVRLAEEDEGFWLMLKGGTTVNITWDEIKVYRGEGSFEISYYDPNQTKKLTAAGMRVSDNYGLLTILKNGTHFFVNDESIEIHPGKGRFDVNVY